MPLLGALLLLTLAAGCGGNLPIPNPFVAEEPTPQPTRPPATLTPTPPPATPAAAAQQATAPAFTPFWVKNHQVTEMWSGPTDAPGVVSFGVTSQQFRSFRVALPPDGPRLFVFNPYTQNYFWINAEAVGPVGPPEQMAGPPPAGQNCADAVYTG